MIKMHCIEASTESPEEFSIDLFTGGFSVGYDMVVDLLEGLPGVGKPLAEAFRDKKSDVMKQMRKNIICEKRPRRTQNETL